MARHTNQQGLSMIEILVAMVIGLIGIIIITNAYLISDNFNKATLGEGGAQVNGLIGLYAIERDARMAGYGLNHDTAMACGTVSWYYNGSYSPNITSTSTLANVILAPVYITADTGTPSNPDRITVMFSGDSERSVPTSIVSFSSAIPEVRADGVTGFSAGDIVLLAKRVTTGACSMARVTSANASTSILQFLPGASAPNNPTAWGSLPTGYTTNDMIFNLGTPTIRTYSISAAKLQMSDALTSAAGTAAQDVVDGVVDLRAQYGKDTDNNGSVDTWDATAPTTSAQWQQVKVIRVGLLARIGNYEKPTSGTDCDATTVAPTWAGGSFPAIDVATTTSQDRCYRYRSFETAAPLRNMLWKQ